MTLQIKDRVCETTTTTGTGALTLNGSVAGYRTFASVCAVGDTCYYYIEAVDANGVPTGDWETGLGTYSAASTLTRTTISDSSNSGAAVSFNSGTKRVALASIASQAGGLALIGVQRPNGSPSVSFTSIPQVFSHLRLMTSGRSTAASVNADARVTFNSDTGANYDIQITISSSTAASATDVVGQAFIHGALITAASGTTAGYAGHGTLEIYNYADTNLNKVCHLNAGYQIGPTVSNFTNWNATAGWRSASAITRIDVTLSSGNWVAGSIVSLYGIV